MKLRFGLGAVIALALLVVAAPAVAAKPDYLEVSDSFADANFCGTGKTIHVRSTALIDLARGRPWFRDATGRHRTVFVNAANGEKVVLKSRGHLLVRRVSEGDGYAVLLSFRGLPARLRIGEGADNVFKLRDPGYIVIVNHFTSEGRYAGSDIVQSRSPDATHDRAMRRFCRIATHGLGL